MKKNTNYVLIILLFLSGSFVLFTSGLLWFVLPQGVGLHGATYCSGKGLGGTGNCQYFLEFNRFQYVTFHNWASVILSILILIHLVLNWRWIITTSKRISKHFRVSAVKVLELYGNVVFLFVLFVFEVLSGLGLWLVIPRGGVDHNHMKQGTGRTLLGLQRDVWVGLHAWIAVIILASIIFHLILNWQWVVGSSKRIFRRVAGH